MPKPYADKEFTQYIVELMQPIGSVSSKRMFGGSGVFMDGLMFGLIANGVLYLKVDDVNRHEFTDLGLEAFSYLKQQKEFKLSYFQAPEYALESSDDMTYWAKSAFSAALRKRG